MAKYSLFILLWLFSIVGFSQQVISTQESILIDRESIQFIGSVPFLFCNIEGKVIQIPFTVQDYLITIYVGNLKAGAYFVKTEDKIYRYYIL